MRVANHSIKMGHSGAYVWCVWIFRDIVMAVIIMHFYPYQCVVCSNITSFVELLIGRPKFLHKLCEHVMIDAIQLS